MIDIDALALAYQEEWDRIENEDEVRDYDQRTERRQRRAAARDKEIHGYRLRVTAMAALLGAETYMPTGIVPSSADSPQVPPTEGKGNGNGMEWIKEGIKNNCLPPLTWWLSTTLLSTLCPAPQSPARTRKLSTCITRFSRCVRAYVTGQAHGLQHLRARWTEDLSRQNLEYWRNFFEYVKTCRFLVGQDHAPHKRPFFADLE